MHAHPLQRFIEQRLQTALNALEPEAPMPKPPKAKASVIVVPVFNGGDKIYRCFESLKRHVDNHHRVLIADDASTDPELTAYLDQLCATDERFVLQRSATNLGYLANVNHALRSLRLPIPALNSWQFSDVLLLNSDTEVAHSFLDRLQRSAYCMPRVAAVNPVSDNATLLSLLDTGELANFSTDQLQELCQTHARHYFPQLPTIVGFCVYLRADALAEVGLFDPFFAPGYGEEDDFAQRARAKGFKLLCAMDVFVRHVGGQSFGVNATVQAIQRRHMSRLCWRWPNYQSDVRTWWRDWPLREFAERLRQALPRSTPIATKRLRILHVLHRQQRLGGTENFVRELTRTLAPVVDQTIISIEATNTWADCVTAVNGGIRQVFLNAGNIQASQSIAGFSADLFDPAVERSFIRFLRAGQFDVVHIHHVAGWNTLMLPLLCRALGVPVIYGLHCHYSLCPDSEMFHSVQGRACGKPFANTGNDTIWGECKQCLAPRQRLRSDASKPDMALYLSARHFLWQQSLAACSEIYLPSTYLRDRYVDAFPALRDKLRVLAHGVEQDLLALRAQLQPQRQAHVRLSIGFFGGSNLSKGWALVRVLAESLSGAEFALYAYGISELERAKSTPSHCHLYPALQGAERFVQMAEMDVVLIPSLVPETFSLVLSEAHALGVVPVVADLGALRERVQHGKTGFCLPANDAGVWLEQLRQLSTPDGRAQLRHMRTHLLEKDVLTAKAVSDKYLANYLQHSTANVNAPRNTTFHDAASEQLAKLRPTGPNEHPLQWSQWRATPQAKRVVAFARDQWAQSQYRVHQPLAALYKAGMIAKPAIWCARQEALPDASELISMQADTLVLLHAIDEASEQLIGALVNQANRPRILMLIDDLLSAPERWINARERSEFKARMRKILLMVDQCICTTAPLAAELSAELDLPEAKFCHIRNTLDERFFNQPKAPEQAGKLRVLWAGAAQHEADLELLLPVVEQSKEKFQWVFFGHMPTSLMGEPSIEFHAPVRYENYAVKLASLAADIAVAPLVDTPFNRCKSDLKLLEYGALGLAVIASAVTPYKDKPTLSATTTEDWIGALQSLADAGQRARLADRLSQWVRSQGRLSSAEQLNQWLTSLH